MHKWEETSRDVISSFVRVFGGTGNDWNFYPRIMRALRSPSPSPHGSDHEVSSEEDEGANGSAKGANAVKSGTSKKSAAAKRKSAEVVKSSSSKRTKT
jgi:hypothetical protein